MTRQKQKRPRTYARNRAASISRRGYEKMFETDGAYFLKLVVFTLLGTIWIKLAQPLVWLNVPLRAIPIGLLVGLLLATKFEKYQPDRKIWYAILIIIAIISNLAGAGVVL